MGNTTSNHTYTDSQTKSDDNTAGDDDISILSQNADVELSLVEQQIVDLFKFKILLLGAGESGR
jgi:hypothetical protein